MPPRGTSTPPWVPPSASLERDRGVHAFAPTRAADEADLNARLSQPNALAVSPNVSRHVPPPRTPLPPARVPPDLSLEPPAAAAAVPDAVQATIDALRRSDQQKTGMRTRSSCAWNGGGMAWVEIGSTNLFISFVAVSVVVSVRVSLVVKRI